MLDREQIEGWAAPAAPSCLGITPEAMTVRVDGRIVEVVPRDGYIHLIERLARALCEVPRGW